MEIVHVVLGKANPERMNGVNKVVNELASHQATAGLSVSLWGIADDTEHNYPKRKYATRLFYKRSFPFSLGDDMIAAIAAQPAGTVFHLHGGFIPQMYAVSSLLHKYGHPFIVTPHGSYNLLAMQKSRLAKSIYTRLFEMPMLNRARMVHVLGNSEVAATKKLCNNVEVMRIQYGYTAKEPAVTEYTGKKPFIIGFCGRIDVFTKGLDALVSGFRIFRERYGVGELWIVGGGNDAEALRNMARKEGVEAHVLFCGPRYGEEKEMFLRRFNIFAHPSRNEGLPASVLEAASLGIPCMVTDATNVGQEVRHYECGVSVSTTDTKSVYKGLAAIYNEILNGRAETLAINARRMVKEAYSWDILIARYTAMYEKALK